MEFFGDRFGRIAVRQEFQFRLLRNIIGQRSDVLHVRVCDGVWNEGRGRRWRGQFRLRFSGAPPRLAGGGGAGSPRD